MIVEERETNRILSDEIYMWFLSPHYFLLYTGSPSDCLFLTLSLLSSLLLLLRFLSELVVSIDNERVSHEDGWRSGHWRRRVWLFLQDNFVPVIE